MKRIGFGIMFMLMLLAVYSSTTILRANSATGASMVISPDITASPNSTFMLDLTINNVIDMRAWDLTFVYSKTIMLSAVDTINDTTFTDGPGLVIFKPEDYNSTFYFADIARTTQSIVPGAGTGSGLVAQLHFLAVSTGTATFESISSEMLNSEMDEITPITVTFPTITVATPPPPPPPPSTVGGWSFSVVKAAAPASYIDIIAIIGVVAILVPTVYFKGIKRRKEKQ